MNRESAEMLRLGLVMFVCSACDPDRKPKEPTPAKAPSVPALEPPPVEAPAPQQQPMRERVPEDFEKSIKGQLDRIDALATQQALFVPEKPDHALRARSGWKVERIHPGTIYGIIHAVDREAASEGKVTYAMLKKNAARYAGRAWQVLNVRILEISEREGITTGRASVGDDQVMFFAGRFETDFVEKDRVDLVGYLAGEYSYEAQAGWKITIPAIALVGMLKAGKREGLVIEGNRFLPKIKLVVGADGITRGELGR